MTSTVTQSGNKVAVNQAIVEGDMATLEEYRREEGRKYKCWGFLAAEHGRLDILLRLHD